MTEENHVPKEVLEKLSQALSRIDRPGSFCVSSSVRAFLPGLEVEGLGPIGLPLTVAQAKELIARCDQAPHGQGIKTVVDTNVRRVWRMGPDRFSLTNPDWAAFVDETIAKVREGLGLQDQELEGHLYDLLLYEPGSFFLPHRDSEKHDRMVATLVIVFPSSYEGGEIVVRHEGHELTIDFGGDPDSKFRIHFAAFYADCEHEVRPLKNGYRLCVVYNLTLAKSEKVLSAPRASQHIEIIGSLLREWVADNSAEKLAITLDHQYTEAGLAWDALKGLDRVKARVLFEAAAQAGCKAYLALLTLWESGSARDDGYEYGYGHGRYRHRRDDDKVDEGEYTMEEVYETSLTATNWSDGEGNGLPIGTLNVAEDEILDPDALKGVKPEEEYEGYTGNEGMTLERWYRRAAIFLWPARRHLEILCDRDSRNVVPVLNQIVAEWRQIAGKEAAEAKAQCIAMAVAILAKWPAIPFAREGPRESKRAELFETLTLLDDPLLIGEFLGVVMIKDVSVDPGESLVPFLQSHGWGIFKEELSTLMESTNLETMERDVRLLEQICLAKPGKKKAGWVELCTAVATALVSAIEASDQKRLSADWRTRKVERADVLAGIARSLIASEQFELLSRFVDHALVLPKTYQLKLAHMPALVSLQPWLKKNVKKPCAALTRWLASCREQLETLTAKAPEEPADFRRPARINCKCADCAELMRFLDDAKESMHRFTMKQERRNHLEAKIQEHGCDLDRALDRRGSPQTLVCTKNKASYQRKLTTYHQEQEYLATVRSIEASLSTK
jgi:2OG-Fe(II) oxygenase superfamily